MIEERMRRDTLVLFMAVAIRAYSAAAPLGEPFVLYPLIEGLERKVFHTSEGHGTVYKEKVDAICCDLPRAIQEEITKNQVWIKPPSHHLGVYIPDAMRLKHAERGLTGILNFIVTLQRFSLTFGPTITEVGAYGQISSFRTEVFSFIDNAAAFGVSLPVAPRPTTIPPKGRVPSMVAVRAHRASVAAVRGAVDGDGVLSTIDLHRQPLSQVTEWANQVFQAKLTHLVKTANELYSLFRHRVEEIALLTDQLSFPNLFRMLSHSNKLYSELVRLNVLRKYANYCRRTPLQIGLRHIRTVEENVPHTIPFRREDPAQTPADATGVLRKGDMLRIIGEVKNDALESFAVKIFSIAPDDPDVGYALGDLYDWFIDGLCDKTLRPEKVIVCETVLLVFRMVVVPRWRWMEADDGYPLKIVGDAVQQTVARCIVATST